MDQGNLDELVDELFDPDLPNVVFATYGNEDGFYGSLSREHIETDEIVGVRSVLLCATKKLSKLSQDHIITVDGQQYFARLIEVRGRAISAVILGK